MRISIFLVAVFASSMAFAETNIDSTSNSQSGATGVGVNGDVSPSQNFTYAPQSNYENKRTLFLPNPGGMANPGSLFVDPGRSINSQVAEMQYRYTRFCGESTPTWVLDEPRYDRVTDTSDDAIDVVFQPHPQYVTEATSYASNMSVKYIDVEENPAYGKKHYCVGSLFLVAKNDEETAALTNLPAVLDRAKRFVAQNLSGFSEITMVTEKQGFAFEREVKGEGQGFSVSPQGAGLPGSIIAGLAGVFSESSSKTGGYERVGAAVLLFAPAPMHSRQAIFSVSPQQVSQK